jgi:hypothetical protein
MLESMRIPFAFLSLAALVSTLGCTSTSETTYVDVGRACVDGVADEAHNVEVDFHVCLSSSCDSVVESMCEATLSGTELTISATATVSSSGGACTADCGQLIVSCETDPLPAGEYQLIFGNLEGTLTVPAATAEPTCLGEE